jgi:putative tricarboxylic transport membrane protein
VDLTFTNWRGIVAAPDITAEEAQRHVDLITQIHDSEAWQQVLEDQGWTDSFATGDEFGSFLNEESQRVEGVLSELGLT